MLDANKVWFTDLLSDLAAVGYRGNTTYDRAYRLVLSGVIATERECNNRRSVRRSDFPKVAAVLGLAPPDKVADPQRASASLAA